MVTLLGSNTIAGVALTVAACGDGTVVVVGEVMPELEPHAASVRASEVETIVESIRCIIGCLVLGKWNITCVYLPVVRMLGNLLA